MTAPPRLVTPDLIEDVCIDVLTRRHPEHLAALERDRGLAPQTIQRLKTVNLLAAHNISLREDTPPAVLLGVFGAPKWTRNTDPGWDLEWDLMIEVRVIGKGRADTLKRRGWYSMTVAECLLQRVPRHQDFLWKIEPKDLDLANGTTIEDNPRVFASGTLAFTVATGRAMQLRGLPPDDTTIPPGTPGGAPVTPYAPPEPWPDVTSHEVEVDLVSFNQED